MRPTKNPEAARIGMLHLAIAAMQIARESWTSKARDAELKRKEWAAHDLTGSRVRAQCVTELIEQGVAKTNAQTQASDHQKYKAHRDEANKLAELKETAELEKSIAYQELEFAKLDVEAHIEMLRASQGSGLVGLGKGYSLAIVDDVKRSARHRELDERADGVIVERGLLGLVINQLMQYYTAESQTLADQLGLLSEDPLFDTRKRGLIMLDETQHRALLDAAVFLVDQGQQGLAEEITLIRSEAASLRDGQPVHADTRRIEWLASKGVYAGSVESWALYGDEVTAHADPEIVIDPDHLRTVIDDWMIREQTAREQAAETTELARL